MTSIAERLARRFGESVAPWVADLPRLVGHLAAEWDLVVGEPYPAGASSVAYRVLNRPAVLKVGPDVPFLAEQVAVLRLFAAGGRVPEVLAATDGAMLLTEIRPGTPVRELAEAPPPAEYAALLTALHSAPLPPLAMVSRDVRPTMEMFLGRARDQLADPVLAPHLRAADFDRAAAELDRLLTTPAPIALVHGDLHLDNVLVGEHGLFAIDPKACRGDPCFDAADYVAAGADRDGELDSRLAGLAVVGYDPDRVLGWCRAGAPALAVPLLRAGRHEAAARLLTLVRQPTSAPSRSSAARPHRRPVR
jgi:streptomycin 6-kinase